MPSQEAKKRQENQDPKITETGGLITEAMGWASQGWASTNNTVYQAISESFPKSKRGLLGYDYRLYKPTKDPLRQLNHPVHSAILAKKDRRLQELLRFNRLSNNAKCSERETLIAYLKGEGVVEFNTFTFKHSKCGPSLIEIEHKPNNRKSKQPITVSLKLGRKNEWNLVEDKAALKPEQYELLYKAAPKAASDVIKAAKPREKKYETSVYVPI